MLQYESLKVFCDWEIEKEDCEDFSYVWVYSPSAPYDHKGFVLVLINGQLYFMLESFFEREGYLEVLEDSIRVSIEFIVPQCPQY